MWLKYNVYKMKEGDVNRRQLWPDLRDCGMMEGRESVNHPKYLESSENVYSLRCWCSARVMLLLGVEKHLLGVLLRGEYPFNYS